MIADVFDVDVRRDKERVHFGSVVNNGDWGHGEVSGNGTGTISQFRQVYFAISRSSFRRHQRRLPLCLSPAAAKQFEEVNGINLIIRIQLIVDFSDSLTVGRVIVSFHSGTSPMA